MRESKIRRNDVGFTLVELVFAAGVMSIGLVLMMQSVISLSHQSKGTDATVAASHFSHSILESMQDRELQALLQFNADQEEFSFDHENGIVTIDGLGKVNLHIYVLTSSDAGTSQRVVAIPVTDEEFDKLTGLPNPVEIQVEMMMDSGMGEGNEFKFRTSTLVYTL